MCLYILVKVFEIIGSTEKSWKKLRKGCHEQFIDQPCMNIWLIIRTSFTNGYVLFDSAMVLLLSLLSVDVSLLLLSSMLLHHTNNLPRYLKKTGSWFQDDVIENVDSVYPVFNMTLSKRYRQK